MTTHKRKKVTKLRGSKTHGHGIGSKHNKGSGNRGGCGMAGTGKRADTKKPSIAADKMYFGKFGFKKKNAVAIKAINLSFFEEKLDKLANEGLVENESGTYRIDISKMGCNKLLGTGSLSKKCVFKAEYASANAVERVKKAGGDVIFTGKKKPAKTAAASQAENAAQKAEPENEN